MCGILVEYNKNFNRSRFNSSLDLLAHRGPDDFGVEIFNGVVGLGSHRLAIQDLSPKGHMPMSDYTKRYWITFNGEIYNFKEIKKELTEYKFKSEGDSEVVLYSYVKWGEDCVSKFNGMFAFVIYDSLTNKIFFARDRLGERPLLYYKDTNRIIISSEAKSILNLLDSAQIKLDTSIISDVLSYRYIPNVKTGFQNINSLPVASYANLTLGNLQRDIMIKKYWDPLSVKICEVKFEDAVSKTEELLISSVKHKLIADVPVGIFLSGGLDSSLIAYMTSKLTKNPITTITVGYSRNDKESEYGGGQFVSKIIGSNHIEIPIDLSKMDIASELDDMFSKLDIPICDPAIFPTFLMSRETSKHLKVVLSGEGADEFFGGYNWNSDIFKIRKYSKIPKNIRRLNYGLLGRIHPRMGFLLQGLSKEPWESLIYKIGCFHPEISNSYYVDKLSILKKEYISDSSTYLKNLFDLNLDDYSISQLYSILLYMPYNILPKADFAALSNSLEARLPFIDNDLSDFALSLHSSVKVNNGISKAILKKIAEKYFPHDFIYQKKRSFSVPFDKWFRNDLYSYLNDTLLSKHSFISKYTDVTVVKKLIEDNKSGVDYSNHLWILLTLEKWGNKYFK